jgi:hypothetical protein
MNLAALVAGAVGGIASWFLTQFVAEPIRRFYALRREIVPAMLDSENVRAPRDERGEVTKDFTEQHAARLRDTQIKLRQLGTQMLSFAHTDALAVKLVKLRHYDPVKAGRSLIGLEHDIAAHGLERKRHRDNVLAALRITPLSA